MNVAAFADVGAVLAAALAGWILGRRSVRRAPGALLRHGPAGRPPYDWQREGFFQEAS